MNKQICVTINTPTKFYEKSSTNHCRLCIEPTKKFSKIFSKTGKLKETADRIKRVTGIGVIESDNFSNVLCRKCCRFLDNVIDFQNKCLANQTKLKSCIRIKRVIASPSKNNENASPRKRLAYLVAPNITPKVISAHPAVHLKRPTNVLTPVLSSNHPNNQIANNEQSNSFILPMPDLFTPPQSPMTAFFTPSFSSKYKFITSETEQKVITSVQTKIPDEISKTLEEVPNIMNSIKTNIIKNISNSCKDLCKHVNGSCLLNNDYDDMVDASFENIWNELKEKHFFLIEIFSAVAGCKSDVENITNSLKVKICFVYSILMNCRWNKLSLLQRINTVLMIEGGGSKLLQSRFNKLGVVLSHSSRNNLLNMIGGHFCDKAIEAVKQNKTLRGTGDNWDLRILVGSMRKDIQNQDLHLFASNLYVNRVSFIHLPNITPMRDLRTCSRMVFIPNVREWKVLRENFKVLVGRVAIEFLKKFKFLEKIVPKHIIHKYSDEMAKRSTITPLPILDCNESSYNDCVTILRQYEKWNFEIRQKAGLIDALPYQFNNPQLPDDPVSHPDQPGAHLSPTQNDPMLNMKIPFAGDQLTRVRFAGAKDLLAGALTPFDRFEHCYPFKCAMFHAKGSFLQLSYSLLYNAQSVGQAGTLKYYREKYNRKNVTPDNVMKCYEGSEELFLSVGKSYIVQALMKFFGMNSADGYPTKNTFPPNMIHQSKNAKQKYFDETFNKFVNDYILRPINQDQGNSCDHVKSYSLCLMYLCVVLLQLNDTAKEGDGERNLINQKLLLSIYKSLSAYSKYAIEMFVSIAQIECLSTPKMSEELKWGYFCNWNGGIGRNIEDDMAQEISNRISKASVKRMGGNRSISAINKISRATTGIKQIRETYDNAVGIHATSSKHATRSSLTDEIDMINDLTPINPFDHVDGRCHESFPDIKHSPQRYLDVADYHEWLDKHKKQMSGFI